MFSMNDPVAAVTALALDAASMQHAVIAHNIANANTPGFVRQRLDFSQHMAAMRALAADPASVADAPAPAPRLVAEGLQGARPDLDAAELAQNSLHYEALLKALGKHLSVLRTAVNEGKR